MPDYKFDWQCSINCLRKSFLTRCSLMLDIYKIYVNDTKIIHMKIYISMHVFVRTYLQCYAHQRPYATIVLMYARRYLYYAATHNRRYHIVHTKRQPMNQSCHRKHTNIALMKTCKAAQNIILCSSQEVQRCVYVTYSRRMSYTVKRKFRSIP